MTANAGSILVCTSSQIGILLIGQGHGGRLGHLLVVLIEQLLVDINFRWRESWGSHEFELRVADQFSGEPQERLLEVVVGLG